MFEEKKRYINSRCEIAYILSKPHRVSAPNDRSSVGARILRFSGSRRTSRGPRRRTSHRRGLCRGRKAKKKNNRRAEGGTYLVLRARRVCNHRGTAKRPSTPSHSASRHSIFFSPRPGSVPAAGHFPSGALRVRPSYRVPSPFAEASCLCFSLPLCRRVTTSAPTL